MGTSLWSLVATFALPAPLALLVLLNVPLPKCVLAAAPVRAPPPPLTPPPPSPRPFRRGVFLFVSRVLDARVLHVFKTIHVMLFLLGLAVASAARALHDLQASHTAAPSPFATPKYEVMFLSKRWRTERNLWLAGFAFSMWAVLAAFVRELGRRMTLEDRLMDFEMSGYTVTQDETTRPGGGGGGATDREGSVSREVTSRKKDFLSPRSLTASPAKPGPRPPRPPGAASTPSPSSAPEVEMVPSAVKKDI